MEENLKMMIFIITFVAFGACTLWIISVYQRAQDMKKQNQELKDKLDAKDIQNHIDRLTDDELTSALDKRLGPSQD